MSLRDYFAGQVLLGIYAAPEFHKRSAPSEGKGLYFSKLAYAQADAMIRAREK